MQILFALALLLPFPSNTIDDVAALRAEGPGAVARLVERYRSLPEGAEKLALETKIDAVAAQRYASVSGLYWYTDLAAAESAARADGKPILSLRMLGRLDEDLSCANSRFFRVALYANQELATFLRDHFVLHWSSERPVPKVTIDFGDGRTIHTTLAGNSAHYVLDAEGRVLDVLPGLYTPIAFRRELEALLPLARLSPSLGDKDRLARIAEAWRVHQERIAELWGTGPIVNEPLVPASIVAAENIAFSKSLSERPLLPPLMPGLDPWAGYAGGRGARRLGEARLDAWSRMLFDRLLDPNFMPAERELCQANFELSMAADTMQNETQVRPAIRGLLAHMNALPSFEDLNRLVYERIFLTPREDPWLGLRLPGVFNGLPNGGIGE